MAQVAGGQVSDAEIIAPSITADRWLADPAATLHDTAAYIASVPAGHPWATWTGIGLGALFLLQRVGPLIPYVGPFIGAAMDRLPAIQPLLNAAWNMASHADEVAADKAKTVVQQEAGNILPIAQAANAKPELIAALKLLAKS
jgi:hypothetical protein